MRQMLEMKLNTIKMCGVMFMPVGWLSMS